MKPLFSLFFIIALTACQASQTTKPASTPVKQDFLTTGRGLSDGAVDLYQPGTDFLPTAEYPTTGRALSPIPGNPNVVVNDPSVTIYSLDTMEVNEVQQMPLPPLQPPVNLQNNYPSPFDNNGNPVK